MYSVSAERLAFRPFLNFEVLMALSFAADIRPLFRDSPDVEVMKNFGLDLSSYDDVKAQAEAIYERLEDGSMPCDEPWPKEQIARFKQWMDEGMTP
jgi:hypothetical protein